MLISAGASNRDDGRAADESSIPSKGKVSAFHTRNAVIVFAIFGLVLVLVDSILYITRLILRLPDKFELIVSHDR